MKIYFSKTIMGFYFEAIHTSTPKDAVEITQSEYRDLLEKQSTGYEIIANKKTIAKQHE
ncbi:hypothetical protein H3T83_03090 [Gilliamella sp. M0320]|uniref:hypothetical protein n=1 Tax=Gilliamella sp. M0320 TaxID=2750965 RepID=UPI0018DBAD09|nr:hypothetical protein [Gilliamella sp. M0320]MBI0060174.1 hypothetical protein [Gilliamella sp. M0320]